MTIERRTEVIPHDGAATTHTMAGGQVRVVRKALESYTVLIEHPAVDAAQLARLRKFHERHRLDRVEVAASDGSTYSGRFEGPYRVEHLGGDRWTARITLRGTRA